MKHKFLSVALLVMALCATTAFAQKPFKLQGSQASEVKNIKYYVYVADEKFQLPDTPTDSINVTNGKFSYKSKYAEPRYIVFQGKVDDKSYDMNRYEFFSVPGQSARMDVKGEEYFITGTDFYKQWNGADECDSQGKKPLLAIIERAQGLQSKQKNMTEEQLEKEYEQMQADYSTGFDNLCAADSVYLVNHNNEEGAVAFFALTSYDYEKAYARIAPALKSTVYGRMMKMRAEQQKQETEANDAKEQSAKANS